MKILVVEDELVIADNLCNLLAKSGYNPLFPAINFTQAIDRIKRDSPDFAILDVHLSGQKDGVDVANYLNDYHQIPFIFLTAYGDDRTLNRVMKSRPAAYLLKPFQKSEIKPTIEIAIMNHKMRQVEDRSDLKDRLSEAEIRVITLIANQKTTSEIASELSLSASTIKNHRHRICAKLELPPSNNALLTWALQNW